MNYAIVYLSSAKPGVQEKEIKELLATTKKINNSEDVEGLLLFSEGTFFQVIAGDTEEIKKLFNKIKADPRHQGLCKIFETPVWKEPDNSYECRFITEDLKNNETASEVFLHHIEILDAKYQKVVENIIKSLLT